MDESFHTTISQVISQEVYKEFSSPSVYENVIANMTLLRGQKILFSGVSATLPTVFKPDDLFLHPIYTVLRGSTFGMNHEDAMFWLRKSVCKEHDGFHANLRHHATLVKSLKQAFCNLDYLWPVNKEVSILQNSADIKKTVKENAAAFKKFEDSLAHTNQ
jgi:hypothetical protein